MSETKSVKPQITDDNMDMYFSKVLAMHLEGLSEVKIAEQLGVTRHQLRKITKSEDFLTKVKDIGDKAVSDAYNAFRSRIRELAPLAYEALRFNLQEKKLDAFREYAKIVGLVSDKNDEVKDNTINIILPGQEEKAITVESKTVTDDA